MDKGKMREQFEAAYVEEMVMCCGEDIRQRATANLAWLQENGDYRDPMVRLAYWAWQASREAVEIELPDRFGMDGFCAGLSPDEDGPVVYVEDLVQKIEAKGLKVAP
ncbi:hypothetical protein ACX3X6_08815 [Pseudomonas sichuanensis]